MKESRHTVGRKSGALLTWTSLFIFCAMFSFSLLSGCGDLSSESDEASGVLSGIIGTVGDGPESLRGGVTAFAAKNLEIAAREFSNVSASDSASLSEKAIARAGLGWVLMKKNDTQGAYESFRQAAPLSIDAAMGMVTVAVEGNSADKIQEALLAIETLGCRDTSRRMVFNIPHGVSEAQTRSLMACLYGFLGDVMSGRHQYAKANELNGGEAAQFISAMRVLDIEP